MAKKLKQPANQEQHQATAQPEAAVEQGRQSPQQQRVEGHDEAPNPPVSANDQSQDADRYNKTRHVHLQK